MLLPFTRKREERKMADNRRYYWLKLKEDFFTDKRIKRLRRISGGDTYTIIYLKLLLLSLKDSGKLYYDGVETDFIKELALTIDETEDDVMVTVNYLMAQGLMEIITENDEYFLTEIPSLIGSETASTRRSRKSRGQKALQCNTDATSCNLLQQNCNGEIEIEKEIDIEKERELESEERDREKISASAEISKYYQSRIGVIDGVQYQQLMDYHTQDKLELDLIKLAIDKAADNGKRSFGYVNTILKNWTQNGIKTIARQEEEQQRYITDKGHAQKTVNITDPFGGNLG